MKTLTWLKMLGVGGVMCIGGPALIYYVMPTEEELLKRYNPELRKRAIETKQERQEDFDKFVTKLKGYAKSDKPVWTVWEEEGEKARKAARESIIEGKRAAAAEEQARKDEIRGSIR